MDYYGPMPLSSRFLAATLLVYSSITVAVEKQPVFGPTSTAQMAAVEEKGLQTRARQLDAELFYEIFLGELTLLSGDPGAGYSLMLEAARQINDEKIYKRAADIALESRSGGAALAAARAWEAALPDSHEAQRYILQILLALNRAAETPTALLKFLETAAPSARKDLILSLPLAYRRSSDRAGALSVVSDALDRYKLDPALAISALLTIGRMQLLAGEPEAALASARQAQKLEPASEDITLMTLDLLQAKIPGAEDLARDSFVGDQPPVMRMGYARVLLEQQEPATAKTQLEIVTASHPEFSQAWLALAALQLQNGAIEAAERSLEQYEATRKGQPATAEQGSAAAQIYILRSEIAEKRGNFEEAEHWLSHVQNGENQYNVQARRAILLVRQDKLTHARALVQSLSASTAEEQSRKTALEVQVLREAGEFKKAYAMQDELARKTPENTDLRYDQAILAEKAQDHTNMERILRDIIASDPDYHHAYNALGYSLAERGIRLQEARQLIETALRMAPGDPFITDSLAWVEYRGGNFPRALELFAEAYAKRKDVEIAAHYGEVLWVSGDRDRARAIWNEAQRTQADNKTLRKTLKRFGVTF